MTNERVHQAIGEVLDSIDPEKLANGAIDLRAPASSIRASDLVYWKKVTAGLKDSQAMFAQAAQLEAQAAQLRQGGMLLQGAFESFHGHLSETYGFDAQTEGVDANGNIQRAAE